MDSFMGEIRAFPFNFAPRGWLLCNGQTLPINQYSALFSLLGTAYGGDGRSTFGLPNLQGRIPMSSGQSGGGSNWPLGSSAGSTSVTLLSTQMASHNHGLGVSSAVGTQTSPGGAQLAKGQAGGLRDQQQARIYSPVTTPSTALSAQSISSVGGNQPHNNMMPYLAFNFCISLQGEYPQRP